MSLDVSRAAECFERALELLPETHPERAGLLTMKAAAAFDAGRYRDAQRVYESALVLTREAGDRLAEGACLDRLATALWEQGDSAGSRSRLAEAVEVLESEPHGPELADCYTSLASDRMVSGRFEEALAWAERSLALSSELGAEQLRPRALSFRGVARCYRGDFGGLDDLHAAIGDRRATGAGAGAGERPGDPRGGCVGNRGAVTSDRGSRTRRASWRPGEGLGDIVVACRTQSVGPLFDLGRWDELVSVSDEVIAWSEAAGSGIDEITARLWEAQVLILRGQMPQPTSDRRLHDPRPGDRRSAGPRSCGCRLGADRSRRRSGRRSDPARGGARSGSRHRPGMVPRALRRGSRSALRGGRGQRIGVEDSSSRRKRSRRAIGSPWLALARPSRKRSA